MKTITKITTLIALSLFTLTSCAQSWGSKGAKGNGIITTETIEVSDYDEINVVGSMDVTLVKGAEGIITVTTDENLHEYVEITSIAGKLKITLRNTINGIRSKKGIIVEVPFTDLDKVSLVGSGDIESNATIKASTMEVTLTGSGDINLLVETENLDSNLTGSGDIRLKGNATNFKAKVSGSGDFDANDLLTDHTSAFVSGSGDLNVNAKKSIKARVNGSGDITYRGNPDKTDTKVSGSGDIESD
ncbi:hypothetical protein SCB49_12594 [unidentified eubacterium SCB49]|nr:hypothetical protein SCB49_12594 [unidentified eubacterium SCB49]